MQVTSATNPTGTMTTVSQAPPANAAPGLGYNAFLQILIAQMKNQDPTTPTDSTQFVTQLATFSNVEQSVQANAKLERLLSTSSITQAQSLIGRTITSADGSISGIVKAVDTDPSNPTVTLDNGRKLPLIAGVKIS